MNERIRQLAIEAGFYANPDVEKFEKFAQLIVRECADVVYSRSGHATPQDLYEHFGVEE